ncbi:hypothetical protein [Devosia sp. DBB001]|nr:hypothetical protein [Devosia sp. DBB001]
MHLLAQFATLFGLEAEALVERAKAQAIIAGAIGFFALIAVAFGLVAAYLGLSLWIGPIWAALAIAGAALLIALIIYAWSRSAEASRKRRETERRRQSEANNLITTAALTAIPMALSSPAIRRVAIPLAALGAVIFFSRREGRSEGEE